MDGQEPGSTLELVVHARHVEADGIVVLDLRAADGRELPPFDAGAHIDVHLDNGLVRQYSLCNSPRERHRYLIGVLRERASRGGSLRVHGLGQGDRVRVGMPRNAFPLQACTGHRVLVAGGIGITPIMAMARYLADAGEEFELHYFARSQSAAAFLKDLAHPALAPRVRLHFDDAGGTLGSLAACLSPACCAQLYICGPAGFIDRVQADALAAGLDADAVRIERFAAAPTVAIEGGETAFEVEAVRSGVRVTVQPGESIASVLEQAGLQVLTSCEQGLCGVCLTRVIEGIPDHRDEFQTDDEKARNDKITICCSRSRSPLLRLDL
jgi:vanillate O-demethylase ferredoxin subunit